MKPERPFLVRCILRDLIRDVRSGEGALGKEYVDRCKSQLVWLWPKRHMTRLDRYGWPVGMPT